MNYQEIEELVDGENLPLIGKNEDEETVFVEAVIFDEEIRYKITTLQKNGWDRINYYHEDGTVEELFKKHVFANDYIVASKKEIGKPNHQRALDIIRNCLCYMADCYGAYHLDKKETLDKFTSQLDLTEEEIIYFGWEELLEDDEEEGF